MKFTETDQLIGKNATPSMFSGPLNPLIDKQEQQKQSLAFLSSFKKLGSNNKGKQGERVVIEISSSSELHDQLENERKDGMPHSSIFQEMRKKHLSLINKVKQKIQSNLQITREQNQQSVTKNPNSTIYQIKKKLQKESTPSPQPFIEKKKNNIQSVQKVNPVPYSFSQTQLAKSFSKYFNNEVKLEHNHFQKPLESGHSIQVERKESKLRQFEDLKQVKFSVEITLLKTPDNLLKKDNKIHENRTILKMQTGPQHAEDNTKNSLKQFPSAKCFQKMPTDQIRTPSNIQQIQVQDDMTSNQLIKKNFKNPLSSASSIGDQSLYSKFIERRIVKEGEPIDLGVLSLDEVVEQCFNMKIISEELHAEFVSFSTQQKILQFIKLFTQNRFSNWNFRELKLTILDHRRLSEWLKNLYPSKYKIGVPLAINQSISTFLNTLYQLSQEDYALMLNVLDSYSKLSLWNNLKIKHRKTLFSLQSHSTQKSRIKKDRSVVKRQPNNDIFNVDTDELKYVNFRKMPMKKRII